jgi:hypothetical protein
LRPSFLRVDPPVALGARADPANPRVQERKGLPRLEARGCRTSKQPHDGPHHPIERSGFFDPEDAFEFRRLLLEGVPTGIDQEGYLTAAKLAGKLQAGTVAEQRVEHGDGGSCAPDGGEGFGAVGEGPRDRKAVGLQSLLKPEGDERLVLDDQDRAARART